MTTRDRTGIKESVTAIGARRLHSGVMAADLEYVLSNEIYDDVLL